MTVGDDRAIAPDGVPDADEQDDDEAQRLDDGPLVEFTATASWQGPLPPPAILAQYEELSPGLAERIVSMAERQGTHRREMERAALDA